jgi:hypothetical protein
VDVPNSSSTLHVPHGNRYLGILPGESYISIRALADLFLCALKYPTSFLAPLSGNGSCSRIEPSSSEFSCSFYYLFSLPPFYHHHHHHTTWIPLLFINILLQRVTCWSLHHLHNRFLQMAISFTLLS